MSRVGICGIGPELKCLVGIFLFQIPDSDFAFILLSSLPVLSPEIVGYVACSVRLALVEGTVYTLPNSDASGVEEDEWK